MTDLERQLEHAAIAAATAKWVAQHGPVPRITTVQISILGPIQQMRERRELKRLAKMGYSTPLQVHQEPD